MNNKNLVTVVWQYGRAVKNTNGSGFEFLFGYF